MASRARGLVEILQDMSQNRLFPYMYPITGGGNLRYRYFCSSFDLF